MNFQNLCANAGPFSRYTGFTLVLFFWYLLKNSLAHLDGLVHLPAGVSFLVQAASFFFLYPFLSAGVLAGVNTIQKTGQSGGGRSFITHAFRLYLRFLVVSMITAVLMVMADRKSGAVENPKTLSEIVHNSIPLVPFYVLTFYWTTALAVDRRGLFIGLFRNFKLLYASPAALAAAIGLPLLSLGYHVAKTLLEHSLSGPDQLSVLGLTAAGSAFVSIGISILSVALYRRAKGELFNEIEAPTDPVLPPEALPAPAGFPRAALTFGLLSAVPPFSLLAVLSGLLTLRRRDEFSLRAACGCCLGIFFTLVYLLVGLGMYLPKAHPTADYQFLAQADPQLAPCVALLASRNYTKAQQTLKKMDLKHAKAQWPYRCTRAVIKDRLGDPTGADADFKSCLADTPTQAGFYALYGRTLLDQNEKNQAAEVFRDGLPYETKNGPNHRMLALVQSSYSPHRIAQIVWYILILLFLFTIHEFGHAYAAWKRGDPTAKDQGRLTLNPLAHLDPVGSVLLPAILLWRNSDLMFGWARPVPVNTENFKNPRRDHLLVSFAGPATNLLVAMGTFLLLLIFALTIRILYPEAQSLKLAFSDAVALTGTAADPVLAAVFYFLKTLLFTSLGIGLFNLIPIPPLDGSWILSGLLPSTMSGLFEKLRPYSPILFIVILVTPVFDYLLLPPFGLAVGLLHLSLLALGFQ